MNTQTGFRTTGTRAAMLAVLLATVAFSCATTNDEPAPVVTPTAQAGTMLRVREISGSQLTVEEFLSAANVSFSVGSRVLLTKAGSELGAAEVRSVDPASRRMVLELLSQAIIASLSDLVIIGDILEGDLNDDEVLQTGASGSMDL